jgi:hypothetical protein
LAATWLPPLLVLHLTSTASAFLSMSRTGRAKIDSDLRCLDVLVDQGQASPGFLAEALAPITGIVTAMIDFAREIYGPMAVGGGRPGALQQGRAGASDRCPT